MNYPELHDLWLKQLGVPFWWRARAELERAAREQSLSTSTSTSASASASASATHAPSDSIAPPTDPSKVEATLDASPVATSKVTEAATTTNISHAENAAEAVVRSNPAPDIRKQLDFINAWQSTFVLDHQPSSEELAFLTQLGQHTVFAMKQLQQRGDANHDRAADEPSMTLDQSMGLLVVDRDLTSESPLVDRYQIERPNIRLTCVTIGVQHMPSVMNFKKSSMTWWSQSTLKEVLHSDADVLFLSDLDGLMKNADQKRMIWQGFLQAMNVPKVDTNV